MLLAVFPLLVAVALGWAQLELVALSEGLPQRVEGVGLPRQELTLVHTAGPGVLVGKVADR